MRGFAFGVLLTIAARLIGWDTITHALGWADDHAKATYSELETQAAHMRAEMNRRERARRGEP